MGLLDRILALGRAPRATVGAGDEGAGAARERAPAPGSRPAPEGPAGPGGGGEFDVFLADMGATPVAPEVSTLAMRDATISELRDSLAKLKPLGEQLAATERARLALEAELAEARLELTRVVEEHDAEVAGLEAELERVVRARERVEDRATKLRAKFRKRDRIATERWHRIRSLQQEKRELQAQLSAGVSDGEAPAGPSSRKGTGSTLRALFDANPDDGGTRTPPAGPPSSSSKGTAARPSGAPTRRT